MTIGDRIKNRRKELGISVDELADRLGKNRATVYRYENGDIETLPSPVLEPLADALSTTPADLMGWKDEGKPKGVKIPILGRVAAGIPIEQIVDVIDTEEIPDDLARTGRFFGLEIHGDSMAPNICDGDRVIVRQQPDAESGEIVIVTVNGNDATCKRLRKLRDGIELLSNNPAYEPFDYSKKQVAQLPVRILGKVVELRRKF